MRSKNIRYLIFFIKQSFFFLLITIFFFMRPVYGQASELEDDWRIFRDAGMRTWQKRLLPEFRKAADEETRDTLDEISFRIVKFADFNAFSNPRDMEIIIPVGLIIMLHNIADATTLTWVKPKCADKLVNYLGLLADVYYQKTQGEEVAYLPEFTKICRISPSEASAIREDDDIYNMKVTMVVDSLAFIVGHEVGHLVLRHKSSRSLSRSAAQKQEYEADTFGMELALEAGFQPSIAGLSMFPLFFLMEGDVGGNGKSNHPPATCRMYRLIKRSMNDMLASEDALNGMKRIGMTKEKFIKSLEALHDNCQNSTGDY